MNCFSSEYNWSNILNPLQIIEIHNTGHALPNKTYPID